MYRLLRKILLRKIAQAVVWIPGLIVISSSSLLPLPVFAQQLNPQLRQRFLADPLSEAPRDPLLPTLAVDRPLSPLELRALSEALAQLDQTAQALLAAGEVEQAFSLWRRELRLQRVFGPVAELNAIRRVAPIAWRQQRSVDVQLLTLRLREIWQTVEAALNDFESQQPLALGEEAPAELANNPEQQLVRGTPRNDIAVLEAIAQTFVTLRDLDSSVEVYQQQIALIQANGGDPTAEQIALAELQLDWFEFAQAAEIYLALLTQARASNSPNQEIAYLERLVYSYQQADSLANAVRAQTDLIDRYQRQGQLEKIPALLLAIAQNYRALNLPNNAIDYYRSAYAAAQRFDQFSFSAQVLKDLGALYEVLGLTREALGAYELLVPVEQQAYNDYGIMSAYDAIGQLQRQQGNTPEAIKAFEQALVIANRLGLREGYFIEQIESLSQAPT